MKRLASIASALICAPLLSSLTAPPEPHRAAGNLGLMIQRIDIGDTIANFRLSSGLILVLLVCLPAGYWALARTRFWLRRHVR